MHETTVVLLIVILELLALLTKTPNEQLKSVDGFVTEAFTYTIESFIVNLEFNASQTTKDDPFPNAKSDWLNLTAFIRTMASETR